jgi:hypothetical protein
MGETANPPHASGTRTTDDIAEAWVKGLTAGDFGSLGDLAAADLRTWHSNDNRWMSRQESEARLADSPPPGAAPAFSEAKVTMTESGFVVQASVELPGMGTTHIVQLLTVDAGHITAVEEYIAPEFPLG